jgi:hypothetical protein
MRVNRNGVRPIGNREQYTPEMVSVRVDWWCLKCHSQ